jgi:hypothetical protein
VGQFGSVHGDVTMGHPRSPEEAAFRDRYMKQKLEEWDAEERWENSGARKTIATIWIMLFFGIPIVGIIIFAASCEAAKSDEEKARQMNGDSVSCTFDGKSSDECPPLESLLPLLESQTNAAPPR